MFSKDNYFNQSCIFQVIKSPTLLANAIVLGSTQGILELVNNNVSLFFILNKNRM